jgi:hypothetical protein
MKAADLDAAFERDADLYPLVDFARARRPNFETRRINVDIPAWMAETLAKESRRLNVTRQALVKMWLAERMEKVD